MKSILGSPLVEQTTDVGGGRGVKYLDIISGYLKHLKTLAEQQAGRQIRSAMLGRPVFFVDDDPVRDAQAQATLEAAARAVGFDEVQCVQGVCNHHAISAVNQKVCDSTSSRWYAHRYRTMRDDKFRLGQLDGRSEQDHQLPSHPRRQHPLRPSV